MITPEDSAPLLRLIDQLVAEQESRAYAIGRRLAPNLTLDDLYCPDDVVALRSDPEFMYAAGALSGLLAAQAALRAEVRSGR